MTRQTNADVLDALRAADPAAATSLSPADAVIAVRRVRAADRPRVRPARWLDRGADAPARTGMDEYLERRAALLAPLLLRYFIRRPSSVEPAQSMSHALRRIWRERADMPPVEDAGRSWLYAIARRSAPVHGNTVRDVRAFDAASEAITEEAYVAGVALLLLGRRDQELVRLVTWEALTVDDAASVVGLRPHAAATAYARAHDRLASAYDTLLHA